MKTMFINVEPGSFEVLYVVGDIGLDTRALRLSLKGWRCFLLGESLICLLCYMWWVILDLIPVPFAFR
ncbi:hypothetical protein PSECIP111951_00529 [Pseudoalteromonas holothuriae]|uniref:Uncharacterized protein n=1 Tax=Pseudoalteromonas holothuriae TaxID=2963714 RepID=A0ABM9GFZ9_9GAMM|nr:hypothetical protein PSECIP111951_00529 [Pseudoalteromonas sp. CIP111951]